MRKSLLICMLLLLVVPSLSAQRSLPASRSVSDYRPDGELRIWTFVMRDSVVGQLRSEVVGRDRENGKDVVIFKQKLNLDYSKLGSDLTMNISGESVVAQDGSFVGSDIKFIINNQTEKLKLNRDDEQIKGYSTRGGERRNQELSTSSDLFAADNNYFDQYELFFAMHDLRVGDTIRDSLFVPQNMTVVPITAFIREFDYRLFYNQVGDSVFVIDLIEPQQMELFFTASKRLAKVDDQLQKMKVYLDAVRVKPVAPTKPMFTLSKFVSLLPNYALYLLLGLLAALFFVGRGYNWGSSWFGLGVGAFLFLPVALFQLPLQETMFVDLYLPKTTAGGSPYVWGLMTIFPAAIFQEGLKFVALFIPARNDLLRGRRLIAFGAMLGAGLGIIESCYLDSMSGPGSLFSWSLLERLFMIVFHTTSGALLGWALLSSKRVAGLSFLIAIIFHLLLRYLPLFVQQAKATPQFMLIMFAVIVLIFLSLTLILLRRNQEV